MIVIQEREPGAARLFLFDGPIVRTASMKTLLPQIEDASSFVKNVGAVFKIQINAYDSNFSVLRNVLRLGFFDE